MAPFLHYNHQTHSLYLSSRLQSTNSLWVQIRYTSSSLMGKSRSSSQLSTQGVRASLGSWKRTRQLPMCRSLRAPTRPSLPLRGKRSVGVGNWGQSDLAFCSLVPDCMEFLFVVTLGVVVVLVLVIVKEQNCDHRY